MIAPHLSRLNEDFVLQQDSATPVTQQQAANAIRALSMDAVQKANSGHPGTPMGMADIAEVLWTKYLKHNPKNPNWADRDRFVLSNGHGSMLIYSLLHLTGYDLSIDDIKDEQHATPLTCSLLMIHLRSMLHFVGHAAHATTPASHIRDHSPRDHPPLDE